MNICNFAILQLQTNGQSKVGYFDEQFCNNIGQKIENKFIRHIWNVMIRNNYSSSMYVRFNECWECFINVQVFHNCFENITHDFFFYKNRYLYSILNVRSFSMLYFHGQTRSYYTIASKQRRMIFLWRMIFKIKIQNSKIENWQILSIYPNS